MINTISGAATGADTHITTGQFFDDDDETAMERAMVIRYFEEPNREHPRGRHWVTAGDKVAVDPGPLPDAIWPPVIHLKEIDTAGQFLGDATMTDAVGLQREYNDSTKRIKEHIEMLSIGKWLVPLGANIQRTKMTHIPGEIIEHSPGLPPVQADLKPLPTDVWAERDRIYQDFETITGIHEVSWGENPEGVTSGRALLTLQEAADSAMGPRDDHAGGIEREARDVAPPDRAAELRPREAVQLHGREPDVPGAVLRGRGPVVHLRRRAAGGQRVPVEQDGEAELRAGPVPARPDAHARPAHRHDRPPTAEGRAPGRREKALSNFGDSDVNEAMREEEFFATFDPETELPPQPLPWQNDAIHLRQHELVLKSASFRSWPPPNQQAFVAHWQMTRMNLIAKMTTGIPGGMPAPGLVGSGGGGQGAGMPPDQGAALHESETATDREPKPGE